MRDELSCKGSLQPARCRRREQHSRHRKLRGREQSHEAAQGVRSSLVLLERRGQGRVLWDMRWEMRPGAAMAIPAQLQRSSTSARVQCGAITQEMDPGETLTSVHSHGNENNKTEPGPD